MKTLPSRYVLVNDLLYSAKPPKALQAVNDITVTVYPHHEDKTVQTFPGIQHQSEVCSLSCRR